jgi:predicted O-methyltransferase YrrM
LEAKRLSPHFPYVPVWEGNLLFQLAQRQATLRTIEIGFATGSTALYMLEAVAPKGGHVTSIDFCQSDFGYLGVKLVGESPYRSHHTLIEGNSNVVLPSLLRQGDKFDLAFTDGWKVFDHLLLDVYYLVRLLKEGGALMFDDARMPSTRRVISIVKRYYGFKEVNYQALGETRSDRAYMMLTTRSVRRPYRAFVKPDGFDRLPAMTQFDWWAEF